MLNGIIKRDGRVVMYDISKIKMAILKAMEADGKPDFAKADEIAVNVEKHFLEKGYNITPTVEEIQDQVEVELMKAGFDSVAKRYILYRASRNNIRERNTSLMKIFDEITFSDALTSDVKRENANVDGDTAMGTMLKYGSEGAKQFYEMYILNPKHAEAHRNGDIHIHDLDFLTLTTTCCQIDIDKLFSNGFSTGHGFLREPNDIASYSALACIAIQSNQNDQHGGQSIPNFDYGMAKGVAKTYRRIYRQNLQRAVELLTDDLNLSEEILKIADKAEAETNAKPKLDDGEVYLANELELLIDKFGEELANKLQKFAFRRANKETDRAVYQAMEAFVHNLNTMHSRAGAQIPFSSINYGTDTTPEGRMVIKNVLLATEAGLGNVDTSNKNAININNIFTLYENI